MGLCTMLLFFEMALWIGPFGWPLGGPGAHGEFRGGTRILLVPVVGASAALLAALLLRNVVPRKFRVRLVLWTTAGVVAAYFLAVDWSLLFGLVLRPFGLAWLVNWVAAAERWKIWLACTFVFWLAFELPQRALAMRSRRLPAAQNKSTPQTEP